MSSDTSARPPLRSAEAIFGSHDLASEIFDRLPPKPAIRFKILSKQWNNFLTMPKSIKVDPNHISPVGFLLAHKDTQNHQTILFSSEKRKTCLPSISFLEKLSVFNVINSSNGLFLCRFALNYRFRHCVINPASRQFFVVPLEPGNPQSENPVFALNFNPLETPYIKIVCFRDTYFYNERKSKESGGLEILIYSSETGTWEPSRNSQGADFSSKAMTFAVSWNGAIVSPCYKVKMTYFDLNKEELNHIPFLERKDDKIKMDRKYLGEWCGNMYAVYLVGKSIDIEFQVFEWDKDTSKWVEKYNVKASKIFSEFPSAVKEEMKYISYHYSIVGVISGDRRAEDALVLGIPGAVISYSFVLDAVKVLLYIPEMRHHTHNLLAFPFCGDFLSYQKSD